MENLRKEMCNVGDFKELKDNQVRKMFTVVGF